MSKKNNKITLKEIFLDASLILAFIITEFYLFGWFYLYEYFSFFSIGIYELDIDHEAIILWGVLGLFEIKGWICITALIFFSCYTFIPKFFLKRKHKVILQSFVIVLSILSFPFFAPYAAKIKTQDISKNCTYTNFPSVKLWTEEVSNKNYKNDFHSGAYRLLLRSKDSAYLTKASKGQGRPVIWNVPFSKVEKIKIYPINVICKE